MDRRVSDRISDVWRRAMADSRAENRNTVAGIEPLAPDDIHQLRLGWTSRFDRPDLRNLVGQYPAISQWIPETGEYLVAGPWRHREEIASVLELFGQHGAAPLLSAFAHAAAENGMMLAILSEHQESRNPSLYERAGFDMIEHIMIYELPGIPRISEDRFHLSFEEMLPVRDHDLEELLELDHAAFPWLWWNSRAEFLNYGRARGVKIYGGRDESGNLVSYVGVTRFRSWGHLDRIAVHPDRQGEGIGLESLEWAIYSLASNGAHRIGLSTQARNERSREIYERFGFRRQAKQDYYLYGVWLQDDGQDLTGNAWT